MTPPKTPKRTRYQVNATGCIALCAIASAVSACKDEIEQPGQEIPGTGGSDGFLTGVVDGDDGVDESGGGEVQGCAFKDHSAPDDAVLFKHECSAEYDLRFTYKLNGSTQVHKNDAVITSNESTYEHPMVAACCTDISDWPDYTPPQGTCLTPHHLACVSDLIEHVCSAPLAWLPKESDKHPLVLGAYQDAAKHFAEKSVRDDCYDHFWSKAGLGSYQTNYCEIQEGGFDFTWHDSFSISEYNNTLEEFSLEAHFVNIAGPNKVLARELPDDPQMCDGPTQNNGERPPYGNARTGGILTTPSAPIRVSMTGPAWLGEVITGDGELSATSSHLRYDWEGTDLVVSDWSMFEAGPTTAGTSAVTSTIDDFSIQLVGDLSAPSEAGKYLIGAGDARFQLQATIDGASDAVSALNTNDFLFYEVPPGRSGCPTTATTCMKTRPFAIGYTDTWGDDWELDIPATVWVR